MLLKNPAVLLITKAADADPAALKASSAEALVVHAVDRDLPVQAIAEARPDLPLIVLTSADDDRTIDLLAAGADEVLAPHASMTDVLRAVRHAMARRLSREQASPRDTPADVLTPQLQAIARLAAGLGHEFNNLLLVIGGNGDMLRDRLPEGTSIRESANAIVDAGRRAAALTRQLLAFGRQQTLVPASVDLNDIVSESVPAIRTAMGALVNVVTDLGRDLPQVKVDPEQVRQVVSSLAATALEGMPLGGTYSISTDLFVAKDEDQRIRPWLKPGRYVRLRLHDTGVGVEEQALPHLFEPFYVPNGTVRGSGLALSSVYGVVKQSGGFIWVDSRLNEGTTVTILLPPIEAPARLAPSTPAPRPESSAIRVLLVEDIEGVREVLKSLLELHHFTVLPVSSAEEALGLMRTETFDILVTDVALPGRSGPDLARDVRQRYPGRPVLFMSGHPMNAMDDADLQNPRAFLQKPFSGQTLVERVRELLGRVPAATNL
jgi:signal transduction histidine kinase